MKDLTLILIVLNLVLLSMMGYFLIHPSFREGGVSLRKVEEHIASHTSELQDQHNRLHAGDREELEHTLKDAHASMHEGEQLRLDLLVENALSKHHNEHHKNMQEEHEAWHAEEQDGTLKKLLEEHLAGHEANLAAAHEALHGNEEGGGEENAVVKKLLEEHLEGHDSKLAAAHSALHGEEGQGKGGLLASGPRPPALPSVRDLKVGTDAEAKRKSHGYGGAGDGLHLGGFKASGIDTEGVSNNTWNMLMWKFGVKSFIDVGCGKGVSADYFRQAGADVLCVEGSHDAVSQSLLPIETIVEHDYTRGPWWPEKTYDALWCVDVLEHIGRQYHPNLLPTLQQSALLFLAASNNGGWHHSEVRSPWWWRAKLESMGFVYSEDLTALTRDAALATSVRNSGGRIIRRMLVFINPAVARRPEHLHLFGGDGCIFENPHNGVPCDERFTWYSQVDVVPREYQSLLDCNFEPKPLEDDIKTMFRAMDQAPHPSYGEFKCRRNPRAFQ